MFVLQLLIPSIFWAPNKYIRIIAILRMRGVYGLGDA